MTTTEIPEGFEPHSRKSPLTDPWEPLYSKRTDKAVIIGLRLAKPHTNGRGLIHGGLIAALSDNAMGYSCAHVMGGVSSLVTIGLAVDFVGTARGRAMACDRERRHQDRQHDLFCAKPDQGRRRRDRAGQCDVSGGAEEGAGRGNLSTSLENAQQMPVGDLGHEIDEGAHLGRQQPRGRIDDVDRQRRLLECGEHDFEPPGFQRLRPPDRPAPGSGRRPVRHTGSRRRRCWW